MKKKAIYYDTETTGVKPGKDRIIEIAAYDPIDERTFCSFVNPECPIPKESTAITNITDEMVQDAPFVKEAMENFSSFCGEEVILIAHNNEAFDKLFLEHEFKRATLPFPSEWIFLDSLKWSRKYRSDLPRHSLQFLRETYGIGENQAHRALDDVMVLHSIFSKMIGDLSWETVLELVAKKPDITRMPFGKHVGKALTEVPKDYIIWLKENGALEKKENANLKEAFEALLS